MTLRKAITLSDLEAMTCPTITADIAAAVLDQDSQNIRDQAHYDPKMLGYPVIVNGRRVKIPRIPFINYLRGITVVSLDDQTIEKIADAVVKKLTVPGIK